MFAPVDAAPWSPDNAWGRSPDGAEPPLPACWLPPPLITFDEPPVWSEGVDTGTGREIAVDLPEWDGSLPNPWLDPITGNAPDATDSQTPGWVEEDAAQDGYTEDFEIAPEPEFPEETTSWVDLIFEEYRSFLEENPQLFQENGVGQSQVMTPSRYLPEIELGTPGAAMVFDRWYEQTYLTPVVELPEESAVVQDLPVVLDNSPGVISICLRSTISEPIAFFARSGDADGDVRPDRSLSSIRPTSHLGLSFASGSAPTQNGSSDPDDPARFPITALLTELSQRDELPLSTKEAGPAGDGELEDAMAAFNPLLATEGLSLVDEDLWLAPLGPNWPSLMIWRPVPLTTRLKGSDQG